MPAIPINDDTNDIDASETDTAASTAQRSGPDDGQLQKLRAERDMLFDRLARATADFKNAQKRMEQESDQRLQYANASLIKSLLPVIDNFERALAVDSSKADAGSILKGMQIVHDQWLNVLKQQQVNEISPQPGTPFDPSKHEAIMQQEAVYPVATVVQLLQKGYSLHDRVLRPAQVAVSKAV